MSCSVDDTSADSLPTPVASNSCWLPLQASTSGAVLLSRSRPELEMPGHCLNCCVSTMLETEVSQVHQIASDLELERQAHESCGFAAGTELAALI